MKENLLFGPQKWAFVVISGGAACALPFVHTGDATPTAAQQAELDSSYGSSRRGATRAAATALEQPALPLPAQQLPAWANADRSPFDDLVGQTASKPEPPLPSDQLPMQPLRPWITAPGEPIALNSATGPSGAGPIGVAPVAAGPILPPPLDARATHNSTSMAPLTAHSVGGSFKNSAASHADSLAASHATSPAAASPWHDQDGWTSGDTENSPIAHAMAQSSSSRAWPDQKLSAEEIQRLAADQRQERTSAVVESALPTLAQPLPHAPSARAAAAQMRFGQPPYATDHTAPPAAPGPTTSQMTTPTPATASPPLPTLPESRKKHIIFQPSPRR